MLGGRRDDDDDDMDDERPFAFRFASPLPLLIISVFNSGHAWPCFGMFFNIVVSKGGNLMSSGDTESAAR